MSYKLVSFGKIVLCVVTQEYTHTYKCTNTYDHIIYCYTTITLVRVIIAHLIQTPGSFIFVSSRFYSIIIFLIFLVIGLGSDISSYIIVCVLIIVYKECCNYGSDVNVVMNDVIDIGKPR